ncbi:hypothetical protein [Bosea sp. ANAM02]|uniref:hypothetical protein n=1 Tax=Bosea sp. ANAM02 TaxID=2020412 RepID=UPI001FCE9817|nr:hypothetical protein [Bosea sp. ANAM02]
MSRQHAAPVLLQSSGEHIALRPIAFSAGPNSVSEADIQALVHQFPGSLPINEIDPMFSGAVSVCTELNTPAGPIDNFLVTASGLPVLVECKLWRNPEARREITGQILDYAKELAKWSSADLHREVNRRLKRHDNALLEIVRRVNPAVDEMEFNDALTTNLRRGRFLLLIVGDGIREGVETIAEYLSAHAGLHFSLGLVEMPIFALPDGSRLAAPRVLARTTVITRHVIAAPADHIVVEASEPTERRTPATSTETIAAGEAYVRFWSEFLDGLTLDDPEQQKPKPFKLGYLSFSMPAPAGSSWLNVYRDMRRGVMGVFLASTRNTAGEYASNLIAEEWETVSKELGGSAIVESDDHGRPRIIDYKVFGSLDDAGTRTKAFEWLRERTNTFVNVLRPRVRSAVADYSASGAANVSG